MKTSVKIVPNLQCLNWIGRLYILHTVPKSIHMLGWALQENMSTSIHTYPASNYFRRLSNLLNSAQNKHYSNNIQIVFNQRHIDPAIQFEQPKHMGNKMATNVYPEKCEIMRITHKRDNSKPSYSFCGKVLRQVNSTKEVGITVCSDLSWSHHVSATVSKANKLVLGLIKWTVGTANPATFSTLYKSLVRPILEYATPIWSPGNREQAVP